jgi:hypothetical protein
MGEIVKVVKSVQTVEVVDIRRMVKWSNGRIVKSGESKYHKTRIMKTRKRFSSLFFSFGVALG